MTALRLMDKVKDMSSMRARAFEIIKRRSFIRGVRKLSSGKISDHYFDMKKTMCDAEGAFVTSTLLFEKLPDERVDYIGGLELGAVPLSGAVACLSYMRGRPVSSFIVRKKAKEHGTENLIENADDLRGKNVVIVDDVTTTGESALKSIRALQSAGANIIMVISILDREEGAAQLYAREGLNFQPLFQASEFLNAR